MVLNEELLGRAAGQARDRMLAGLEELPGPDHDFSEAFEKNMRRLIRTHNTHPFVRYARTAAVIILAGFVGLSVCIMSVDAWRVKLFKMVEEKFPRYSSITYQPVDGSSAQDFPEFELAEYRPSYIPDGYLLTDQILNTHVNWSSYTDAQDNYIAFHQSILGTATSAINTEGSELVEFEMNGDVAYKMTNLGSHFVLWSDEQYEYQIVTSGEGLSLDDVIKIAQSVTVCPKGAYHPPELELQLSDLPVDYLVQTAVINGDIVVMDGNISNLEKLDAFLESIQKEIPAIVRLADYDRGKPVTRDLYFDGLRVRCTSDETRNPDSQEEGTVERSYKSISRQEDGENMVVSLTDKEGKTQELFRYARQSSK